MKCKVVSRKTWNLKIRLCRLIFHLVLPIVVSIEQIIQGLKIDFVDTFFAFNNFNNAYDHTSRHFQCSKKM
jgi:hypothetical protein